MRPPSNQRGLKMAYDNTRNHSQSFTLDDIKHVIETSIDDSLERRSRIDATIHYHGHEFIRVLIEERKIKEKIAEDFRGKLVGVIVIGIGGGLLWIGQVVARKIGLIF